jgi:MFS family permease
VLGGIAAALAVVLFGHFSDIVGAKNVYVVGVLSLVVWAFPYFVLVNSKQPFLIVTAVAFAFFTFGAMYGPLASFVANAFPARLRYSGSSVAYAIGAVLGGGIAPMASTFLVDTFNSAFSVSTYLISLALLGLIGALKLKEL